jgi:hypothetical protein
MQVPHTPHTGNHLASSGGSKEEPIAEEGSPRPKPGLPGELTDPSSSLAAAGLTTSCSVLVTSLRRGYALPYGPDAPAVAAQATLPSQEVRLEARQQLALDLLFTEDQLSRTTVAMVSASWVWSSYYSVGSRHGRPFMVVNVCMR